MLLGLNGCKLTASQLFSLSSLHGRADWASQGDKPREAAGPTEHVFMSVPDTLPAVLTSTAVLCDSGLLF